MLSVVQKAATPSILKQCRVFSAQYRQQIPASPVPESVTTQHQHQHPAAMSTSPPLPTIATKTRGIEKSVWWVDTLT